MLDNLTSAVLVLISSLCLWLFIRASKNKRKWDMLKKLPGPTPWPIFGNVKELGFLSRKTSKTINPLSIFFQTREGLGKLFYDKKLYIIWIGSRPVVALFGAQSVEALLKSNVMIDKGDFYKLLEPWLGDGLLLSKGEKWRRHRKLLTPTFHFRILDNFLPIMNEQSLVLVQKLHTASKQRDWVDILHYLSMCALDIICETAMGVRMGAQQDDESEYVKAVQEFLGTTAMRGPKPWLRYDFIFNLTESGKKFQKILNTLHTFTETVIRDRLSEDKKSSNHPNTDPENQEKKKLAFLDMLLESPEADFSPKELREQVDTFMFAGHDTTSTAMGWVFYLLGLYPEIQSKVQDEMDQVFGNDKSRSVSQDDLKQLKYLECVMKESQRLYPSIPGFARAISDDLQIGEFTIPKGVTLAVNTYLIHRDPEFYPNPEIFDPDRFLPENASGRNPFAFIPFSAGPRNCVGQRYALMEQKVILSHVLRNFQVVSLDPRDKIHLLPAAVLRTVGPLRISFQLR